MVISSSIEKRADLNVYDVTPEVDVAYMRIPVVFVHGTKDSFVALSHSESLFDNYGGKDKTLIKIDQGHNTSRPEETNEQIVKFLCYRLTGNLVDFRNLIGNAATTENEEDTQNSSLLPKGWSKEEKTMPE
jgi:fermentation-respiration switch protein FrsA (DUF1100 family)